MNTINLKDAIHNQNMAHVADLTPVHTTHHVLPMTNAEYMNMLYSEEVQNVREGFLLVEGLGTEQEHTGWIDEKTFEELYRHPGDSVRFVPRGDCDDKPSRWVRFLRFIGVNV